MKRAAEKDAQRIQPTATIHPTTVLEVKGNTKNDLTGNTTENIERKRSGIIE